MKSYLKAIVHTIFTFAAFYLPTVIDHNQILNNSVGAVIALIINYVISHTIATTNGASAIQTQIETQ